MILHNKTCAAKVLLVECIVGGLFVCFMSGLNI